MKLSLRFWLITLGSLGTIAIVIGRMDEGSMYVQPVTVGLLLAWSLAYSLVVVRKIRQQEKEAQKRQQQTRRRNWFRNLLQRRLSSDVSDQFIDNEEPTADMKWYRKVYGNTNKNRNAR